MKYIISVIIILVVLLLPSHSYAHISVKNARNATYNEINYSAPSEGYKMSREEKNEIKCNRLTKIRYHCIFSYFPLLCAIRGDYKGFIHGYSYVVFRRYGTEVDLHIKYHEC